jgi:hypothetical protein
MERCRVLLALSTTLVVVDWTTKGSTIDSHAHLGVVMLVIRKFGH